MIGGIVVETIVLPDKVWINVKEPQSTSTSAIYVANTPAAQSVSEGDSIWWQSNLALWTPKNGSGETYARSDIRLERIGFSGSKRP